MFNLILIKKMEQQTEEPKLITLPPQLIQVCMKRLGAYCSTQLGEDKYYLFSVVKIILEYIEQEKGGDWLKENYPYYDAKLEKRLRILESLVNIIKGKLDLIKDKTMEKKKEERTKKDDYIRALSKMPLFEVDLIRLFVFLERKTNLHRQIMKSEDFRELDLAKHRKTELDKPKSTTTS